MPLALILSVAVGTGAAVHLVTAAVLGRRADHLPGGALATGLGIDFSEGHLILCLVAALAGHVTAVYVMKFIRSKHGEKPLL